MELTKETIMMISSGPLGMMIVGYWIKASIKRVESIPGIMFKLDHIDAKLTEMNIELKYLREAKDMNKEKIIILEQSVKAQWKNLDDIQDKIKTMRQ